MNANELADELESCRDYELPEFVHKTATTLRQQQAEIESLRKNLDVALMIVNKQELTDGQIMQVWWDANDITDDDTVIEFARAILRKASEK